MATIAAQSTSREHVGAAVGLAANGDTVTIPAGDSIWTTNLTATKAITLQGAGAGSTILRDGVLTGPFMKWNMVPGLPFRMTGIEFHNGGRVIPANNGNIQLLDPSGTGNTNGHSCRIDHCVFDHLNGNVLTPDSVFGVIDHNIFLADPGQVIYCRMSWWNGGDHGDGSYADASMLGTDRFIFIEDCEFVGDVGKDHAPIDGSSGARVVFRKNTVTRGHLALHGTDSGNRRHGARSFEWYDNDFFGDNSSGIVGNVRSGTGVIYDLRATGYRALSPGSKITLDTHRQENAFQVFGGAHGTNLWDVNKPGGPFATGTVATSGTLTFTVAGTPWTNDQWKYYSVKKTSGSSSGAQFALIMSNTANSITYKPNSFGPGNMVTAPGDTFAFWQVIHSMDQVGRTRGSLLSGNPPAVPPGYNDQITEPLYMWNVTTTEGPIIDFGGVVGSIRYGEHIISGTPKPGYTPYIYPHPLVSGGVPPVTSAPLILRKF